MGSIGLAELLPETENTEFGDIPDGIYAAEISGSEWRTSQAGHRYVSVEFTLTDALAGRKIWTNLNFEFPNKDVQDMAMRIGSDIARSVGLQGLQEPEELIGHELMIKTGDDSKKLRKEVKRYMAKERASTPPPTAAANGAATGQAQGPYPWEA